MKKMNFAKRIACLVLAVMMAVPVASVANLPAASTVEAAKAKNVTMYVGEKVDLGFTNSEIKKLKTTNKKVVKAGTYKPYSYKHSYIEAKKKGTATISFKRYSKTYKYKVTVKKAKITATAKQIAGTSKILIAIKNKEKQTFEDVSIKYTVKDKSGDVVAQKTIEGTDLQAGKTSYEYAYANVSYDVYNAGFTCTAKVTPLFHQLTGKYTNVSNKVKASAKVTSNGRSLNLTIKNKNKKSGYTDGMVYVFFYENGKVVGFDSTSLYMEKNTTKTTEIYGPYDGWDNYKIITNAWYWK